MDTITFWFLEGILRELAELRGLVWIGFEPERFHLLLQVRNPKPYSVQFLGERIEPEQTHTFRVPGSALELWKKLRRR